MIMSVHAQQDCCGVSLTTILCSASYTRKVSLWSKNFTRKLLLFQLVSMDNLEYYSILGPSGETSKHLDGDLNEEEYMSLQPSQLHTYISHHSCMIKKVVLTCVSGARTNLYFLKELTSAILISIIANLLPMHCRGPQPKGICVSGSRSAFSSGLKLNLHE